MVGIQIWRRDPEPISASHGDYNYMWSTRRLLRLSPWTVRRQFLGSGAIRQYWGDKDATRQKRDNLAVGYAGTTRLSFPKPHMDTYCRKPPFMCRRSYGKGLGPPTLRRAFAAYQEKDIPPHRSTDSAAQATAAATAKSLDSK